MATHGKLKVDRDKANKATLKADHNLIENSTIFANGIQHNRLLRRAHIQLKGKVPKIPLKLLPSIKEAKPSELLLHALSGQINTADESLERQFWCEIQRNSNALALVDTLPHDIRLDLSGKWVRSVLSCLFLTTNQPSRLFAHTLFQNVQQIRLNYAGKAHHIGVFDSKIDATMAYELARAA